MEEFFLALVAVVGVIAIVAGLGLLLAFPIMWCWNYTMPHLFDLPIITWGQAWCLNFIAHILIKSSQTNNNK